MAESQQAGGQPARKRGRPPILSPQLIEDIALPVRAGNPIVTAAAFAGVDKDTLYDWLKKAGRLRRKILADPDVELSDDEVLLCDFSDALRKAMAEASIRDIARIDKAAENGAWQAAAWRRERREPDLWGRTAIYQRPSGSDDELKPPDEREDTVIAAALMIPSTLPEDVHALMIEALRQRGELPGQVAGSEGTAP